MSKELFDDEVEIKNYDNEPDEPVEEATEEAAEEVVEEAVGEAVEAAREPQSEPKEEKNWMHQAMHEERERRKEIQRELETSRQQMQKMEERFQQLIKKKEEPEPEVPKFDDNPAINLNTRLTEAEKRLKEAAERDIQYQKMAEVQQHQARFAQDFSGIEEAYAKTKPDYYEAVQFLGQSRIEEYMTLGMSQQQALQAAHNDAMAIAVNSAQTGQNGPDVFYKLAVKRGWKGAAPKAPQKAAQDLEALARNVQESTSLGTSGGKDGDLTLASLADMDDDAFMKATSGDRWRKLWGA